MGKYICLRHYLRHSRQLRLCYDSWYRFSTVNQPAQSATYADSKIVMLC
jgi:hypothetical protein